MQIGMLSITLLLMATCACSVETRDPASSAVAKTSLSADEVENAIKKVGRTEGWHVTVTRKDGDEKDKQLIEIEDNKGMEIVVHNPFQTSQYDIAAFTREPKNKVSAVKGVERIKAALE